MQKARGINCVLLDKTATLTVGAPKTTDFECFNGDEINCLKLAAAIEVNSNHPIAECVKAYAETQGANDWTVENYRYETGKGAIAERGGETYRLGNRKLLSSALEKQARKLEERFSEQGKTVVFLSDETQILAIFAVADTLKETSVEAVASLKARSIRTAMLTGDSENVAKAIAQKVGIDEYFAEALPEDKAKAVERVRSVGGVVAMVGDGINDSPALKEADVGVAMGTGTDIAIDSADVVLVRGDLRSVSTMVDLSKATVRNIKQNLFWAFFYNCVAIPIAAGAFAFVGIALNPMIAAACMSLSSLFVVTNALRLTRFGKKKEETCDGGCLLATEQKTEKEKEKMEKTLHIEGMMCMHCVAHVKKALDGVDGVSQTVVDLAGKTAKVTLLKAVSDEQLSAPVTEAGYEVISIE